MDHQSVELRSVSVGNTKDGKVTLIVNVEVASDNEFDAIAWLLSVINPELGI